jgi:ketosteroid isomerase-like protein
VTRELVYREGFSDPDEALDAVGLSEEAMSQANVDAVRSSLDGWNCGDIDGWLGAPNPEIEFHTSGIYPGTDPVYRGESGLRRFWASFREPWESLQILVDQARDLGGDEVLALCTFEGHARNGMTVRRKVAWIWRFVDGQAARVDAYGSWDQALEAVGLSK